MGVAKETVEKSFLEYGRVCVWVKGHRLIYEEFSLLIFGNTFLVKVSEECVSLAPRCSQEKKGEQRMFLSKLRMESAWSGLILGMAEWQRGLELEPDTIVPEKNHAPLGRRRARQPVAGDGMMMWRPLMLWKKQRQWTRARPCHLSNLAG